MRARIVLSFRSEGTETVRTDFILSLAWLRNLKATHGESPDIHPDSVRKVKTMKDSINYFIPIMQDPMNDITGRCLTHHVSSNTYYGYQPVVTKEGEAQRQQQQMFAERMDTCDDGNIQFNNLIEVDAEEENLKRDKEVRGCVNRKRTWVYDEDLPDYKKRRENVDDPFLLLRQPPSPEQHPNGKCLHVRQPTHNIPDMPRCMMGHYI